jgi:hypothetical protein
MQVRVVGSTVPMVGNVATVHDIAVDVGQIGIWHLFVLGQVVVEHITADGQVTVVEVVDSGPALGAELFAADNQGVVHAETEEKCLVLRELVGLSSLELRIIELGECTTKVRLEILRSLVSNLNGVLHDRLWHDFH